MKKFISILFLAATLTACATAQTLGTPSIDSTAAAPTDILGQLRQHFLSDLGNLFGGSAPSFESNDLANAHAILADHFAKTGNLYDQAGVQCVEKLQLHQPELQALTTLPTPPELAAPVTGFFSGIAAAQVKAESAAAAVRNVRALLQNGVPPDIDIACAYLRPGGLLRGLLAKQPSVQVKP